MKTGPSPTERTREFLSPQGVFAPSRFLLRKTLLHPFFRKQAALPSTQDRTLGANKTKKKTRHLRLTSHGGHACPGTNPLRCAVAALRFLLPGCRRPLPGRPLGGGSAVSWRRLSGDRQREAPEAGAGPGWLQRRPGRPKRSSSRRPC